MKICNKCKLPSEFGNFYKSKTSADGLSPRCKTCDKEASKQKHVKRTSSFEGRAKYLLSKYKYEDQEKGLLCDLDIPFLAELIQQPCTYCDTLDKIGADRIDNNFGHLKTNVKPCCYLCNAVRSNNFTSEEMKIIGPVIADIIKKRELF